MRPSQKCIDLVKSFEGFKSEAYKCPAGVWTIGYGTTENVQPGDTVTEQQAEAMLLEDLMEASKAVDDLVDVQITQAQYDALTSFIYNVGREAFRNSTLLKLLNAGNYDGAAKQLPRWNKAGGQVLAGLSRRRAAEAALFES
jgi:lysozyme